MEFGSTGQLMRSFTFSAPMHQLSPIEFANLQIELINNINAFWSAGKRVQMKIHQPDICGEHALHQLCELCKSNNVLASNDFMYF